MNRVFSFHALRAYGVIGLVSSAIATPALAVVSIDFSTDDFGTTLTNGQSISTIARSDRQGVPFSSDTVLEFGNLFDVTSIIYGTGDGHLDAAIFDSTSGVNSRDPDLWVNLGNIMILQNDDDKSTTLDPTFGLVFDIPNDEQSKSDQGAILFSFHQPVELLSLDMVDFNGGAGATLTLTDASSLEREYIVPSKWTYDIAVSQHITGAKGWETLDLTTLADQVGEKNSKAIASEDAGFDPLNVRSLEVRFDGDPASAGIDNLTFNVIPETPSWAIWSLLAAVGLCWRCRRAR